MEATIAQTDAAQFVIPVAHREAAERYVAVIVSREPEALLGGAFIETRKRELLDRFEADYMSLSRGPYARHGADALRIALGKL
jgi:hypothetical protein